MKGMQNLYLLVDKMNSTCLDLKYRIIWNTPHTRLFVII
jgi:hypothetical protein